MKLYIKIGWALTAIASFCRCTDVVQVKLDQGSKIYVIDAFLTNQRSMQVIRVTTNNSYFSDNAAPVIPNALVSLKDLNSSAVYNFTYTGAGNYAYYPARSDTMARINHQYSLTVTIGNDLYSSVSEQKRGASIDSITDKPLNRQGGFGGSTKGLYTCRLAAKDRADNNPDYYLVKTYRNDTLFFGAGDINLSIDGTGGPVMDIPVDSTDFVEPIVLLGFKRYHLGDSCKVEIHSLTRDAYNFFLQAGNQITNGGLFATTPENVKTNIITPPNASVKAVGWFNIATVASKKIEVK